MVSLALIALTLAGAAFLEAAGPLSLLAPGETVIVVGAAGLGLGPAALAASGGAVSLGALLGSLGLYGLTRLAGGGRWPRLARALERALPPDGRLARFTRRRSTWLLVGGRFLAVGRAAIPVLAAQARIPFAPFALWTALGTVLWSAWLVGLGASLGRAAEALFPPQVGWAGALAAALAVATLAGIRTRRRKRAGTSRIRRPPAL